MNTRLKKIQSVDEIHARFVRRREQSVAPLPGKLTWVGSLLVLLVLAVASFNAHAQLPNPGIEVVVVSDATAAAQVAEGDGYQAALVNFRFIANTVWTTNEAAQAIRASKLQTHNRRAT